jgi:hypothetical protein
MSLKNPAAPAIPTRANFSGMQIKAPGHCGNDTIVEPEILSVEMGKTYIHPNPAFALKTNTMQNGVRGHSTHYRYGGPKIPNIPVFHYLGCISSRRV